MQTVGNQTVPLEEHLLLKKSFDELQVQFSMLQHELAQLKRLIFGAKTERFVPGEQPAQLQLFAESPPPGPTEAEEKIEKIIRVSRAPKVVKIAPHGRGPLPAELPRVEIRLEPTADTTGWRHIGDEITEELEWRPGRFFVRKFVRPKYARPDFSPENGASGAVVVAPLHRRPIEKGIPGAGLLAAILVGKFVDHLPVYRLARHFERHGVALPDSTLNDWLHAAADLLAPLFQALRRQILSADYLQMDETPIRVLEKEPVLGSKSEKKLAKNGGTHRGYFWVCHAPRDKIAIFEYDPRRTADLPNDLLQDFQGILQTDGYVVYDFFSGKKGVRLAGCLAHARRGFEAALGNDAERATFVLKKIQQLYAVERTARGQNLGAEKRLDLRRELSRPVFDSLVGYLEGEQYRLLPKSPIAKAVGYFLNRREKLGLFLLDGALEIDNNLVENAIRPVALGRKNYLFAGNHDAARRLARIYSLVACCKSHGVNPYDWFRDVLFRLPDHPVNRVAELLPHCWKPADCYPDWWAVE